MNSLPELRSQVVDALQTFDLLLVGTTVLFGIRYPRIIKILQAEMPYGYAKVERLKSQTMGTLLADCIPLLTFSGLIAYLYLPLTVRVIENCSVNLWYFDVLVTGFVFMEIAVIVFCLWMLLLTVRVVAKLRYICRNSKEEACKVQKRNG